MTTHVCIFNVFFRRLCKERVPFTSKVVCSILTSVKVCRRLSIFPHYQVELRPWHFSLNYTKIIREYMQFANTTATVLKRSQTTSYKKMASSAIKISVWQILTYAWKSSPRVRTVSSFIPHCHCHLAHMSEFSSVFLHGKNFTWEVLLSRLKDNICGLFRVIRRKVLLSTRKETSVSRS